MVYWFYLIFQIRNALEKERESTDRERVRHQAKLEEIRDKYESALKQVREELEAERQGHTHLNTSVNKIKKVCKQSFLFCDFLVAVDYFIRKPHANYIFHRLRSKYTRKQMVGIFRLVLQTTHRFLTSSVHII